jgi:hypothetical protein
MPRLIDKCLIVVCTLTAACTPPSPDSPGPPGPRPPLTDSGDTDDTDDSDTEPQGIPYDCSQVPVNHLEFNQLDKPRGYHDVEFDDVGMIIGNNTPNTDLLKATYDGDVQAFIPGSGLVQQMVWLPDGDLAVASEKYGVVRVGTNGSVSVIAGDVRAYGLILGPDEMLYSANQEVVHRIDPVSGSVEILVGKVPKGTPRVLNFNLDYTKLYIGTFGGTNGSVFTVDLDSNLDPVDNPKLFVSGVGDGGFHDGLGIDICGNLYIPDYGTSALWRVSATGTVQKFWEAGGLLNPKYPHGLKWGTGSDGWRDDAIYMPQPYNNNKVGELVIGVPSRHWTEGYAINL